MRPIFALGLASLASFINCTASALEIGDPAPPLKVSQWVKGTPVAGIETGKVYVVEFWATWCGPCVQSIPHLTEVAHATRGKATFVGVDVWEDDTNAVFKFVNKMGEKMDYSVAIDTKDTFMANEWMKKAGQNGIPTAFIVNHEGLIAWIGHPMGGLDKPLYAVIEGKWDITLARKRAGARKQIDDLYASAKKGADVSTMEKTARELEVLDAQIGGIYTDRKFSAEGFLAELRFSAAWQALMNAVLAGDQTNTIEKLETAARAAAPKTQDFEKRSAQLKLRFGEIKNQALFREYLAAVRNDDKDQIANLAPQLGQMRCRDFQFLNSIAWTLLTDEKIKTRDLPLACKLAKAAVDACEGREPAILDTYARALFDSGRIAEAVDYQKRAIAAATQTEEKGALTEALKKYEAAAARSGTNATAR